VDKIEIYVGSALIVAVINEKFEMVITVGDLRKFFFAERAHDGMAYIGCLELDNLEMINEAGENYRNHKPISKSELDRLYVFRDRVVTVYNSWKRNS